MSIVNLVTINCPNCTAALEATCDTLRLRCKYCKQEIDVENSIVHARTDYNSRLTTYEDMAENALKVSDFDSAETYYRLICELNSSKDNLLRYNICCFLNSNIPYNNSFIEDIGILDENDATMYSKLIYKAVLKKRDAEIEAATEYCTTESIRKMKTDVVKDAYVKTLNTIARKILEYDPDCVELEKESDAKRAVSNMPTILSVAFAVLIIFIFIYIFFW